MQPKSLQWRFMACIKTTVHNMHNVYAPEKGRAMAQAVSRRPLTAEYRVRARVNPCGICDGQSGNATGFSPTSSVFPCQYHSTVVLHTHISSGGWTICPLVAAVQRRSLTPSKSTSYYVEQRSLLNSTQHSASWEPNVTHLVKKFPARMSSTVFTRVRYLCLSWAR
jgi:hypothetical protein